MCCFEPTVEERMERREREIESAKEARTADFWKRYRSGNRYMVSANCESPYGYVVFVVARTATEAGAVHVVTRQPAV